MDNKNAEFFKGVPFRDWLADGLHEWRAPFSDPSVLNVILRDLSRSFVLSLERMLGCELYVKKSLNDPDRVPRRFYSLLEKWADNEVIENISFPEPIAGWPRLPALHIRGHYDVTASGYGLDYDVASTKAIAEILERSSLATWDEKKIMRGSYADLKSRGAVDPEIFTAFSKNQLAREEYASHCIDAQSVLQWISCASLLDRGRVLIPAQIIYLQFAQTKNESVIRQATSNGAAAGASYEMALHNAICESIERDALMIHWLNNITPPRVSLESLTRFKNDTINTILDEYKKYEIDVSLLDITTDIGVPVFMATIRDIAKGWPLIFISPRADLDIESAIAACLLDGLRAGYWPKVSEDLIRDAESTEFHIDTFDKRRAYWCLPDASAKIEFLFEGRVKEIGENSFQSANFATKLQKMKELLIAQKLETYIADITSGTAKEAGLKVLKVIIPELYPLYLDERYKYLGIKRLYRAPIKMGAFTSPKKENELNISPHPML